MTGRFFRAAAVAALAFAGAGGALAAPPAAAMQAQYDWTATVAATPEGGFRMGNPAAAVKVVEYVSLSCPHCRQFSEASRVELFGNHVAGGRVSFEIRPFPLDPVAAVGAQINRCVAPDQAFGFNEAILGSQDDWFARLDAVTPAQVAELNAMSPVALRQRLAAMLGFDAVAARHGVGPAALAACLGDDAGAARLAQIKSAAEALGVGGTPTFLINGAVAEHVHDWTALQARLRAGR